MRSNREADGSTAENSPAKNSLISKAKKREVVRDAGSDLSDGTV